MKSSFPEFPRSDESLECALRQSAPKPDVPATLHNSIIEAVEQAAPVALRPASARQSAWPQIFSGAMRRWMPNLHIGWLQASALAAIALLGVWFVLHPHRDQETSNTAGLAEISAAFSTSQEIVSALPSASIDPLADELNNVNRDLDRTAEFLLATLP